MSSTSGSDEEVLERRDDASAAGVGDLWLEGGPLHGRLVVVGELDLLGHERFAEALDGLLRLPTPRRTVDLRRLDFIDVTASGALRRALERADAAGIEVEVVAACPWVTRTLHLLGVQRAALVERPAPTRSTP